MNKLVINWVKYFNKHTYNHFKNIYRLLVLNNYENYYLNNFKEYCKNNKILTLYMLNYSFHLF